MWRKAKKGRMRREKGRERNEKKREEKNTGKERGRDGKKKRNQRVSGPALQLLPTCGCPPSFPIDLYFYST
jgi:hypothetical protein